MTKKNENPCLGSTLESFLKEEGIFEEVEENTLKVYIAFQIRNALKESNITQTELAKRMKTSRAAVRRILDPRNPAITIATLSKVTHTLDKRITIDIK